MKKQTVAVLTNDLQYDLVEKTKERVIAIKEAAGKFRSFLGSMRVLGCPIFHLQLINRPDDPNIELHQGRILATKGSKGAQVMAEFVAEGDVIVEKNKDSGFYETALEGLLREHGIETVIITGMQTQICVQTTAADAFFRGYNVWVPEDCVVSARSEDKIRSLDWMAGYCATISTGPEIVSRLSKGEVLSRMSSVTP